MSEKIKLVQGDTRPALVVNLTDDTTGDPIVITGATVLLKFRGLGDDAVLTTLTGSIADGVNGQVVFHWASVPSSLDVDAGDYEGEIEITFADGQVQTVYDVLKFKVRSEF
jgi:hypothetical protein